MYLLFLSQFWNNKQMFELSELSTLTTIGFVWVVTAVVLSITDEWRESTKTCAALKAPRLTLKFSCFKRKTGVHHRIQFRSCITEQRNQHRKPSGWAKKSGENRNLSFFGLFWCDTVVKETLTAVSRFIRTVPTIIHRVTLPPERDALVCSTAKLWAPPTNTEGEKRFGLRVDMWLSRLAPVFFKII